MIRALAYVAVIVVAAVGLSWLADRPGELVINWQGYEIQTSVFRAIVMVGLLAIAAIAVWSLVRALLHGPANVGQYFRRRRHERGFEALSAGMIAVGSGDRALANRYAALARKSLPNEPLTQLLRAQAAQLRGDRGEARRIYEAMRNSPETELLGLRGLYLEAQQEKEGEAARQYAERAASLNPRLGWSVESLFEMQCRERDWQGALDTLAKARKNGQIDKKIADRRRAVLLTAQAVEAEENEAARALALAAEAHGLAPDLVPAAAVAGRLLASQGATPKAARILQRTWRRAPHPDIAAAYAYARIGDSPRDRLKRVKELAQLTPNSDEGQIAVAVAAIDAQEWEDARRALQYRADSNPSQRICTLMARIEGGQHGDTGKVREWLARAVHAVRDPAWVADGHVSSRWAPTSPVTGALDAFVWQEPTDTLDRSDSDLLIEQLMPEKNGTAMFQGRTKAIEAIEVEDPIAEEAAAQPVAAPGAGAAPTPSAAAEPARQAAPMPARTAAPGAATTDDRPAVSASSGVVKSPARDMADVSARSAAGAVSGRVPMTAGAIDAVPPMRPPDDPGPEIGDVDDARAPVPVVRASQKRPH